jgi:hypothetical protein
MTPLAGACLELLEAEAGYPPLSAESLSRVLWVTGGSPAAHPATVQEIDEALEELLSAGKVERVWSRRLGPRYRAMPMPKAGTAAQDGAGETIPEGF